MGGSREQSQGLPAASMGCLSLISIFAAPLRNLEEMRLCMLKRAASLQGSSRALSTRGKALPEQTEEGQERRESGRGRLREKREQKQRAPKPGWELLCWLCAAASIHKGDMWRQCKSCFLSIRNRMGQFQQQGIILQCYLSEATEKKPARKIQMKWVCYCKLTDPSENGSKSKWGSLLCSAQQRIQRNSPRWGDEGVSLNNRKKKSEERLSPIFLTKCCE